MAGTRVNMLGDFAMAREVDARRGAPAWPSGKTEGGLRMHPGRAVRCRPSRPRSPGPGCAMQALYVSTFSVAVAEIGDKTQLLALLLAARYRKPWPIVAGILVSTVLNHALAASMGAMMAQWLTPQALRWSVAASFIAIALWTLKPDRLDDDAGIPAHGAFIATSIAFFLAEIGDKTQVATVLLAANYTPLWQVILGTTLGMLLANVPVVVLGSRFADRLPLQAARSIAALLFLVLGAWVALRGIG